MQLHFVVAGFSKCGTTSLCSMLNAHPNLFIPPRMKEPQFFNRKDYLFFWNWYRNLFYTAPADALLGEGSTSYTGKEFASVSIRRIVKYFPDIKIIIIARDPVSRLESSYRQMHNNGTDWGIHCPFNIEEALIQLPNMLEDTNYYEILQIYLQHLSENQLLVLFQEDLKSHPDLVLKKCFDFFGVKSIAINHLKNKQLNLGENKYYDTAKLRDLQNIMLHPVTARASSQISVAVRDQFLPQLELRQPFGKDKIEWSKGARKCLVQALDEVPFKFLEKFGKDHSFWPRYTQFFNEA